MHTRFRESNCARMARVLWLLEATTTSQLHIAAKTSSVLASLTKVPVIRQLTEVVAGP